MDSMLTSTTTQEGIEAHKNEEAAALDPASLLQQLTTESQNEASQGFDTKSALEIARITTNHANAGEGRQADADRAVTELEQRNNDLMQAEADLLTSSSISVINDRISPVAEPDRSASFRTSSATTAKPRP